MGSAFSKKQVALGALVILLIAGLDILSQKNGGGLCAQYSRENSVKTRAISLNEWNSCQYFDGSAWRSIHTDKEMKWLVWSAR
jgi:hypothetical protein